MRPILLAAAAALAAVTLSAAAAHVPKKALKLLHLIEQVDGAGSGLDADTVRGMTPSAFAAGRLLVKDSHGALVGPVVSVPPTFLDSSLIVVRTVGAGPVAFAVTADGFETTGSGALVYASPDCSGPARLNSMTRSGTYCASG